jgi:c-di-GMP-binding flagellar brake protein YcgR
VAVTVIGAIRQKKLFIGKKVQIQGKDADLETTAKVVQCDADTLMLELFASAVYPHEKLHSQKKMTVSFVVPEDAIYSFDGYVVSYNDGAQILLLEQVTPLKRTEQRQNYRLKTAKLMYLSLEEDNGNGLAGASWQQAGLLDISRGGASVLSPVSVPAKYIVKVLIPLTEVDYVLETQAQVVREKKGDEGQIILGLTFQDLTLLGQERILDYILKVWSGSHNERTESKQVNI